MLLYLTDIESGLFHLFGASSKGKTISLLAAVSVFERAQKTMLISWALCEKDDLAPHQWHDGDG